MQTTITVLQTCSASAGCGWPEFILLINQLIRFAVFLAVSFATLSFAYAGFLLLTSGANPGQRSKAKGIMGNSILGIIFVLIAWLIVQYILTELGLPSSYSLLG